jgi:hypothetical protein
MSHLFSRLHATDWGTIELLKRKTHRLGRSVA